MSVPLHTARSWPASPANNALSEGSDLGLIGFLLGIHLLLLIGFLAGIHWGDAVAGYATAVVIVAGREFVRQLARQLWNRNERRGA